MRNCHRLEEPEETWQLNTMWDAGLNPGPDKEIREKPGEIQVRFVA